MIRGQVIPAAVILGLAAWVSACSRPLAPTPALTSRVPAARPSRPNIVILLADDLGYGELGCQGNSQVPTPHIDALARQGIRFTSAYVTASNCSPSRAGLLTGRFPTRFGHEFNPTGARNEDPAAGLPVGERTLAGVLQDAGYATALVGKWHLGGTAPYHPQRRGFDEFFGFLHEGHFFVPPPWEGVITMLRRRALPNGGRGRWISPDRRLVLSTHMGHDEPPYDADNPILRGGQPVAEPEYFTDAITRESVDFIDRHAHRPFLLLVAYSAVHSPLQGADAYMRKMDHIEDIHRRIFAAMLANLDDSVGAITDRLREAGLERDTLVFFLSDNGGPTRELTSSNAPLRGGKGQVYEGGIRVPFVLRWRGHLPAGAVENRPICATDIFPTAAAAAGVPLPDAAPRDGMNLLPYLTGTETSWPRRPLYWRQGAKTALRLGDWKLLRHGRPGRPGPWELYHLAEDLAEQNDLAAKDPDKLEELRTTWARLDGEMVEARFR